MWCTEVEQTYKAASNVFEYSGKVSRISTSCSVLNVNLSLVSVFLMHVKSSALTKTLCVSQLRNIHLCSVIYMLPSGSLTSNRTSLHWKCKWSGTLPPDAPPPPPNLSKPEAQATRNQLQTGVPPSRISGQLYQPRTPLIYTCPGHLSDWLRSLWQRKPLSLRCRC